MCNYVCTNSFDPNMCIVSSIQYYLFAMTAFQSFQIVCILLYELKMFVLSKYCQ